MLFELLEILRHGGPQTYAALAQRLQVSEPLLEGMLADLERLGYLRQVRSACAGPGSAHCAGCPMAGTCAIGAKGRIWALTNKGATASST